MNWKPQRVLVIEDDPAAARLVGHVLEKEGYQVLTAPNGVEGLRKARDEEPDLVVLDVLLPGLDGFALCHRLRADPRTKELPVMMLSGKVREADKATGLKVGADEYVTKPIDVSELVKRLKALLARKNARKAKIVGFVGCQPGVGTSTVAANVAVFLSLQKQRTVLVDLSENRATIPALLSLDPERSIAKLFGGADDGAKGQGVMALLTEHHYSGLRVLSSPRPPDGSPLPISSPGPLFQGLREMVDCIILDVSGRPCELEKAAILDCDLVVIITGSDAGGLAQAGSRLAALVAAGLDESRFAVVVVDRDGTLTDVEFPRMKRVVESMIPIPLLAILPYDLKVPLEFEPQGMSVVLAEPNRPVSLAIGQLAQRLFDEEYTRSLQKSADGGEET